MDTPLELEEIQPEPMRRYDGEESRRPVVDYAGIERRVMDPPTEQDHPAEWFEPN